MDKRFDPSTYEQKWQRRWAERAYFTAQEVSDREPYCIMIPPPNVTGRLHMGHALQSAIQDLLVRWRRMQGYNALWLPGTDHAGIATQLMVERRARATEGSQPRGGGTGRAFLRRIWAVEGRAPGQYPEASSTSWAPAAIGPGSDSLWTTSLSTSRARGVRRASTEEGAIIPA